MKLFSREPQIIGTVDDIWSKKILWNRGILPLLEDDSD
jgi:hypothetical protein